MSNPVNITAGQVGSWLESTTSETMPDYYRTAPLHEAHSYRLGWLESAIANAAITPDGWRKFRAELIKEISKVKGEA